MTAKRKPSKKKTTLELTVQFGRGVRIAPMTTARLKSVVLQSLQSDFAINLRFTGRDEARRLNRQFRKRSYTPNVLTFSYLPDSSADIVICTPVVRDQARKQHKSFADHLAHMVVHGCLHAQGYDHETDRSARSMEGLERMILAKFGVADPYQCQSGRDKR
jgi:probable rRNA maturation factor